MSNIKNIIKLLEMSEITLSIYHLGRMVVGEIFPDRLFDFPEFNYTQEQEQNLLLLLAEIQRGSLTSDRYQEI